MRIMQITNAQSISIHDSSHDDDTKQMMLVLQNLIVEETVSLIRRSITPAWQKKLLRRSLT